MMIKTRSIDNNVTSWLAKKVNRKVKVANRKVKKVNRKVKEVNRKVKVVNKKVKKVNRKVKKVNKKVKFAKSSRAGRETEIQTLNLKETKIDKLSFQRKNTVIVEFSNKQKVVNQKFRMNLE